MSAPTSWEASNARYVALALARLRLFVDRANAHDPTRAESIAAHLASLDRDLADCEAASGFPPATVQLQQRFGLSSFELDVLMLCVAMELDPALAQACRDVHGAACPTFAFALSVLPEPAWDALSPQRPLRYFRLIETGGNASIALTMRPLRADERIVHYVKGLDHLDERLLALVAPGAPDDAVERLQPSQEPAVDAIEGAWAAAVGGATPVVELLGRCTASKRQVARTAAARLGYRVCWLAADALPSNADDLDLAVRLWQRECILQAVVLCAEYPESDPGREHGHDAALRRFLGRVGGLAILDCREPVSIPGRPHLAIEVAKPTRDEQAAAWRAILGPKMARTAGELAAQFDLDLASIARIAERVPSKAKNDVKAAALWDAARSSARPNLERLAQRIDAKATWDDIVLTEEASLQLAGICAQVRGRSTVYDRWGFAEKMNRGFGISALFEGASGVGKTMAAEVIANELRLDLYRIDLSRVVSKYIGETEGNLRRVFDAAEDGGAILFFDECDALFSKRSEVKDSHDRYANIEVNYLLQRIETFRGLAILATNLKSALDSAFVRRLRFIVNFPFPSTAERRAMWTKVFPAGVKCEPLDFDRLARLNLTGSNIHSAALGAAFLAAEKEETVTMAMVLAAVRSELVKLERPINEADFRLSEPPRIAA